MLFGIARCICVLLIAWFVVRSPLRRGMRITSAGAKVISDRQLVIMCAIMAAALALGVLFERFH
jgi:hypothetical protein